MYSRLLYSFGGLIQLSSRANIGGHTKALRMTYDRDGVGNSIVNLSASLDD